MAERVLRWGTAGRLPGRREPVLLYLSPIYHPCPQPWGSFRRFVHAPAFRVRRNYPYLGGSDSLVTHLRRVHGERAYAGVELEVNQRHVATRGWPALVAAVTDAFEAALEKSRCDIEQ
jgi:hypothetical protein